MTTVKGKENQHVRLWRQFYKKLIELGIDAGQAGWLVKWAEGFAKAMNGPLATRSANDIFRYLEQLARRPKIRDWQLKQAVQALQHLYQGDKETIGDRPRFCLSPMEQSWSVPD